jgi:coenzyme F420-0:L-glutamate ligase/coenzyme F420-1:gamma-L-glutamate ligase
MTSIQIIPLEGLPEIEPGVNLAGLIHRTVVKQGTPLANRDILMVSQKIVSKAEGRLVPLDTVVPSHFARHIAEEQKRDPRLVELILRESRRIVRIDKGLLIVETHHGFVCANAGVDLSNVTGGDVASLLPEDPDASAKKLREGLRALAGVDLAVIITDTFGRPWREGLMNVAIGVAGLRPLRSFLGMRDPQGYPLQATVQAVADELAAAADLLFGKLERVPVGIIRDFAYEAGEGSIQELIRPPDRDLFR